MDTDQYLDMFIEESKEHLQAMNQGLLRLESEPGDIQTINEIFRSAHTLKGMAGSMGFEDLASLTHDMENVLDLVRNEKLQINTEMMDIIFQCVDVIEKMVMGIEDGGDGKEDVAKIVTNLKKIQNPNAPSATEVEVLSDDRKETEEIEIDEYQLAVIKEAEKLGNHLYEIKVVFEEKCLMKSVRAFMVFQTVEDLGELIQTVPVVQQIEEDDFGNFFTMLLLSPHESEEIRSQIAAVSEVAHVLILERKAEAAGQDQPKKQRKAKAVSQPVQANTKKQRTQSIRVDIEKLNQLMNLFSELIIDRGRLEQIEKQVELPELAETVEHMARISTDLQGLILHMRMVPVEQVFNRFPRMVRDLAKELHKKVNLVIEGEETELDRTVIDEIGDPLVHLLRNALDHGLESPEERVKSGKPEEGTVSLKAHYSGNHVFIEVGDNGKGIDREKVLQKALEKGGVTAEEAEMLTDQQVYGLILSSGFSTAQQISDVSGRGVGLDVVKTKIESLGGVITIDSTPGQGSTFRIQLPLTLSIIFAMLVKVEAETFAIPFNSIDEITTVSDHQISTLHGKKVVQFRGQVVPLVYLKEEFNVPAAENEAEEKQLHIVVVRKGEQILGLVVDTVIGQQEVVLKSLGGLLTNLYAISGATILGNGEVALIIDSNQFF